MLDVLIIKPLTYISPSTFITWSKCQNRVYQGKLAGKAYIPRITSKAAAIGTAFDAFIKHAIMTRRKEDCPETKQLQFIFDKLKKDLEKGLDIDEICKEGRALATGFIKRGFINEFVDLNNKISLDVEAYRICDGIPLLGIIDIIKNGIPVDLKTRGFGRDKKTYSHGGYVEKITAEGVKKIGIHELLELKSMDWAIQLYFYSKILEVDSCRIIEVCNQTNGTFETAFHDSKFSSTFSTEIDRKIEAMWPSVSGLSTQIKEPVPGWQCREYGTLCEVALRCPKFISTLAAEVKENA